MRVQRFILGLFFFFFAVTYILPADAKVGDMKMTKEEGPVDIEADELTYERETQLYQAHGQVEVNRGDLSLKADHAQLNMATKDLVAWGNVLLREGEDVIECERLEVNLDTRLGKIHQAKTLFEGSEFSYHRPRGGEIGGESLSNSRWFVHDLRCETAALEIYGEGIGSERDGFRGMGNCQRRHLLS